MAEETLDLFASPPPPRSIAGIDLAEYRRKIAQLAALGLYVGTSSWKYAGWLGTVYDESRYTTKRGFSNPTFEKQCLAEYAETYSTVCVDAGYYQFPTVEYLGGLCAQVPEGFKFTFKVTDDITIKKFPNIARIGAKAGTINPNFLNAEMFKRLFLEPCSRYRSKIGALIFEFSQFHKADYEHGKQFVDALDQFLGALPKDFDYSVEIRNKAWLQPDYFDMLRSHGVAHVFNNWTRMPSVGEQMTIAGSETTSFGVARFLLKPGRAYQNAVDMFSPYKEVQERVDEARTAAAKLLESSFELKRLIYIYINNRLEGSAPITIAEILRMLLIFEAMLEYQKP